MDDDIRDMARHCFGYGRWEAPYWFIGPEQGQSPHEKDALQPPVRAWKQLGGGELCDCRQFHALIGEERWHREKSTLQQTWRPLLLSLASFLGKPTENEALRLYQRDKWGTINGETCVVELSGLAARNFEVPRDRISFRQDRVAVIRERISRYKPVFVVMYGTGDREHWEAIASQPFPPNGVLRVGSSVLALMPHPVSRGLTNDHWKRLGLELRRVVGNRLDCRE